MNVTIKTRIAQLRRGEVPDGYRVIYHYTIPLDWDVYRMRKLTYRVSRPNRQDCGATAYSINNQEGFVPQSEQFGDGSYAELDKASYKIVYRN